MKGAKGSLVWRVHRLNAQKNKSKINVSSSNSDNMNQDRQFPEFSDSEIKLKMLEFNSLDEKTEIQRIQELMFETFNYRRTLGLEILIKFPRFLTIPDLVSSNLSIFNNFVVMLGNIFAGCIGFFSNVS